MVWALAYYGITLGSPASATLGMRAMEIEMRTWYGAPAYFVLGVVHAIVYWVSVSVLTPFIVVVGFLNSRKRLLHDMLVGAVIINNTDASGLLTRSGGELYAKWPLTCRLSRAIYGVAGGVSAAEKANNGAMRHVTQHSRDTPQFYLTAPSPCPYLERQGRA